MHQDFPGKETHRRHVFFISIAEWSVKADEKLMSQVAKGKEKTRDKNGKTAKCAEEQDKESSYMQLSKLRFEASVLYTNVFASRMVLA